MDDQIKKKIDFIKIAPDGITYGFNAKYIKEADGGLSWYIPSFDIFYSSSSFEDGDRLANIMTKSFFTFWIQEKGFRSFVLQMFKLGYQTDTHAEFKALLNRTNLSANLRSKTKILPKEFETAQTSEQKGSLAIAV